MPYRFEPAESIPVNTKRVVSEQAKSAVAHLRTGDSAKRDEAIHEGRKSIKSMRAILKLVRSELGPKYDEANSALREAGRKLSELRDAGVMVETFDSVVAPKDSPGKHAEDLAPIRKRLLQKQKQAGQSSDLRKTMKEAAASLAEFSKQAPEWPVHFDSVQSDSFQSVAAGFAKTYKDGRKAMRKAAGKQNPELWHEWRKRAKDHLYHVRLLKSIWTKELEKHEDSAHKLESALGDDHNLVVLRDHLRKDPAQFGDDRQVELLLGQMAKHQKKLRKKALTLGSKVYKTRPKTFAAGIGKLWEKSLTTKTAA